MKRILKIFLLLVLILMLPASLLSVGLSLPAYYSETYYAELPAMLQRIRSADGPRLILLGNSDIAFGVNGELLESILAEKGLSYTVCPFGLYGAVGTSAMLSLSEKELRSGDLVIFSVEPVRETLSAYFGATAFWKCAESDPSLLLSLSGRQLQAMLANHIEFLQSRFAYRRNGTAPQVQGVYSKGSFNDRCDLVYERTGNTMALGYDFSSPVELSEVTVSEDFTGQFTAYCRAAARKGARVCVSFSPVNRLSLTDGDSSAVLSYFNRIRSALPCPVISDPNRYILDSGWFYDSNFHLNTAGATLRTVELARDIAVFSGCFDPIDYPVPEMPSSVYHPVQNNGDEAAFTYVPIADTAWQITGLTAYGEAMTALTVPALYGGKPVVGFSPAALKDARFLEEVTIPQSVETLPDGLFSSCPSLMRVYLTHTEKPCGVSAHTFDRADHLRILVPSEAYSLYCDGTGCALNPWDPFLGRIDWY